MLVSAWVYLYLDSKKQYATFGILFLAIQLQIDPAGIVLCICACS
jgi:hypothetical protein